MQKNNSLFARKIHTTGIVVRLSFAVDVSFVGFDGAGADAHLEGDLLVGKFLANELQHI